MTNTNTNFQITLPSTSATQQSKHSNDAIPNSRIHSTMTTHPSTSNANWNVSLRRTYAQNGLYMHGL